MTSAESVLSVHDLDVRYPIPGGAIRAVRGVSFDIARGQIFGLVGESGSGKSTVAMAALGALGGKAEITGTVTYQGRNLLSAPEDELRGLWGRRLALVFQGAGATLNPVLRVGDQVMEVILAHARCDRARASARMLELLRIVQLPEPRAIARRYPHQLSGGQQQRICIAIAIACDPDVLVLDEPTTGLDVTTEAHILDLVESLRARTGAAIVYITHNLGVVSRLCDVVAVMYAGEIAEQGAVEAVFRAPRHPYTRALLDCLPSVTGPRRSPWLPAVEGGLPDPRLSIDSCQFAPRCRLAREQCRASPPALEPTADAGHLSRCFFWREVQGASEALRAGSLPAAANIRSANPVLKVRDLVHSYDEGLMWSGLGTPVRTLDGVSLDVNAGEIVAVVGESGSGKTTLARCIVGLQRPKAGEIQVDGRPLPRAGHQWSRALRRRVQMVFQNPDLTLNPQRTIKNAILRPLKLFGIAAGGGRIAAVTEWLKAVRLGERFLDALPNALSGGERQRVAIARAFAPEPDLVVADEPTSALDASVQAAVLNLLVDLQRKRGVAYLLISHDLSVVRHLADRVYVIYLGSIVESGRAEDVFTPPYHPYTEALLSAVPRVGTRPEGARLRLEGPTTGATAVPTGCKLHTRCPRKIGPICEQQVPPLVADARGHALACHIPVAELRRLQSDRRQPGERDHGHH